MKRRKFIARSSAGLIFTLVSQGIWSCEQKKSQGLKFDLKPYRPGKTMGKVHQVTPDDGFYINTYYDVCPFSPTGRFLAVSKLPFQGRYSELGETADICTIHTDTGKPGCDAHPVWSRDYK